METNLIEYRPVFQPKQAALRKLVENSPATWIGYGGSRGGAKSYVARLLMWKRCEDWPGTRRCIFRRTYDLVRENHVEKLFAEYPALRQLYHLGDKELRFPNGSVIAFRYGETPNDIENFIGKEYMDIFVDQAEMLTERELNTLKSCCRWPGTRDDQCKFILTFNPGNVGHAFLKRIFFDRNYNEREHAEDYAFVQAHGWDNVEWSRSSLTQDGLTEDNYYNWDEDTRFDYYINRSQFGREQNALPPSVRLGWLMGSMDQFGGQYFDLFSVERHVKPFTVEPWHTRWLGIDWGFAHEASCYWSAQIEAKKIGTYREFCGAGRSPRALAQEIVDRTPPAERQQLRAIWLSHDAFDKTDEREPIAAQMGEVFSHNGMPWPQNAGKNPTSRATLLYDMLKSDEILIDPRCPRLIETIPMVSRDPEHSEKCVKFEGDDPYDGFTHSLMSHMALKPMPKESRVREDAKKIEDPLAKWFFLTKQLKNLKTATVIHPNIVMPRQRRMP